MEASLRCRLLAASAKQTAAVQKRHSPSVYVPRMQVLLSAATCFLNPVAAARRHRHHCTVAGVLAIILCTTGTQTGMTVQDGLSLPTHSMRSESLIKSCVWSGSSKFTRITCHYAFYRLDVSSKLLAATGAQAGPTCTTTDGSPPTADCNAVAAYLQKLPSSQKCGPDSNGVGDCTPMWTIGTCVASVCGAMGTSIACSDAGADVSTLAVSCASGGTGILESTTAAGSLIPYGNGNLQISISHS